MSKQPAIFFDRDGVLVEDIYYPQSGEWEAPLNRDDVRLIPGAAEVVRELRRAGYFIVIVSNQGGFAKGKASLESLLDVHRRVIDLLAAESATIDDCYYSYSHPDGRIPGFSGPSVERKPSPYFLMLAAASHGLDLSRSWMVGDRTSDISCGRAAGVRTILKYNERANEKAAGAEPHFRVTNISELLDIVPAVTNK